MSYRSIISLPLHLQAATEQLLLRADLHALTKNADNLSLRYRNHQSSAIIDIDFALAYLALRFPATYAQIYSAADHIKQLLPEFTPISVLDLGCGPGGGLTALKELWPSIARYDGVDFSDTFQPLFSKLNEQHTETIHTNYSQQDLNKPFVISESYDLILVSNLFNELNPNSHRALLNTIIQSNPKLCLIIEPGTPEGANIIQLLAKHSISSIPVISPYINNSIINDKNNWFHFIQRFHRPEYLRRLRSVFRHNSLPASDIETANYSYLALSPLPVNSPPIGRLIQQPKMHKGYHELSILTEQGIIQKKIVKRNKPLFLSTKKMVWGDPVFDKKLIEG